MATINALNNNSAPFTVTSGNATITSGNLAITAATTSTVGQITQGGTRLLHTFNGATNFFAGSSAGNFTTTQTNSTCVGGSAGVALTGTGNGQAFFGYTAGTAVTSGSSNTAIGAQALLNLTTGNYNVCLGGQAGTSLATSDSNNICIGTIAVGTGGVSNRLQIGSGTGTGIGNLNSAFISGITGITVTGTAVLVSSTNQLGISVSSRKYKDNIKDMDDASSAIMDLRPVTFTLKEYQDKSIQFGLIAEEVYEVMPELVVLDKEGQPQTVQYHNLPSLLLNEIQKLRKELDEIKRRL